MAVRVTKTVRVCAGGVEHGAGWAHVDPGGALDGFFLSSFGAGLVVASIPWTPVARPLSKCTVSLVSSAALALKTDPPFDPEIERRDPWFADPSYRVLPRTARTGDVEVCHLHINPGFAEQDLNSVLPAERLDELAEPGEIGAAAPPQCAQHGQNLIG